MGYADLHVHSYFSDGTMSPAEILADAEKKGVLLLAISDHDKIEGTLELLERCKKSAVRCVPAVEITTIQDGFQTHILGYGFDVRNLDFCRFLRKNRDVLDGMSDRLIAKLEKIMPEISVEEYNEFRSPLNGGGWKALHYFVSKGVCKTLREGMALYDAHGITFQSAGFCDVETACKAVHDAGGITVLAHPGHTFPFESAKSFEELLLKMISFGIDGIECRYPLHTKEVTEICLDICRKNGLKITSGSDCHGSFSGNAIGYMKTDISDINLI